MPAPLAAALSVAGSVVSALGSASELLSPNRIKAVSQEFESVFLSNMMEEMFAGVEEDGPFDSGPGGSAWRSIRTEEFARSIAAAGGIGLAEHVQSHLIALQEKSK
ncbi:MAG TPA: rod-binding protein [Xanthobacteraceae bacterium]|jgi:Rod binding domain-containing protein